MGAGEEETARCLNARAGDVCQNIRLCVEGV